MKLARKRESVLANISHMLVAPVSSDLARLNMIGESPTFKRALQLLERVARTDATVLLNGETGTGKELAARAVHFLGARRQHPFVPINCGALHETLVESELFGHQRGAFTGAVADAPGILRLAEGGTVFLDEIDSLSPKAQVSLLRFLQDHRFRPLGGRREEVANVRIIAASNRNLEKLIRTGEFRPDLYFRLKLLTVTLPPLRERGTDVQLLAEHFVRIFAHRYSISIRGIHERTLKWLPLYSWPGNVRELENLVHSEFLLSESSELSFDPPVEPHTDLSADVEIPEVDEVACYAQAKERALAAFDRDYLTRLLAQTGGNVTHAARLAGKKDARSVNSLSAIKSRSRTNNNSSTPFTPISLIDFPSPHSSG
jgi:two-component system response regulator GlrR